MSNWKKRHCEFHGWTQCACEGMCSRHCVDEACLSCYRQAHCGICITQSMSSGYPKHCHRCCRLLDLCSCRSHLTELQKLSEEADKRDKRITDLEEQVESFEQLVADLMVTVKSLNDRINGR